MGRGGGGAPDDLQDGQKFRENVKRATLDYYGPILSHMEVSAWPAAWITALTHGVASQVADGHIRPSYHRARPQFRSKRMLMMIAE